MNETRSELSPCPCCGSHTVSAPGTFDICVICKWEDDPTQSADPDCRGGANRLSLSEARRQWASQISSRAFALLPQRDSLIPVINMTTSSIALSVSYNQVAVFASDLENPFNDWQDQHVAQGFSWREHSVSFRTLNEFGCCSIEIDLTECHPGSDDAIRAIRVPFSVQEDGKIEIGSIGDSVPLSIAPGAYALLFQILTVRPDGTEVIRLSFSKSEPMDFAIIKADEQITTSGPLCITSQSAT